MGALGSHDISDDAQRLPEDDPQQRIFRFGSLIPPRVEGKMSCFIVANVVLNEARQQQLRQAKECCGIAPHYDTDTLRGLAGCSNSDKPRSVVESCPGQHGHAEGSRERVGEYCPGTEVKK